jgi:hypothetical protein
MELKDFGWVCTALSFFAAFLNARKVRQCFLIWQVSTTGFLVIDYYYKMYAQCALWVGFIILNQYGYHQWGKLNGNKS